MAEADETEWVSIILQLCPTVQANISQRMEPLGWDKDDCEYYVLDDDRLYRRTAPPIPPAPKQKAKPKPKPKRNTRSTKRRRISRAIPDTSPEETEHEQEPEATNGVEEEKIIDEYSKFGGFTWNLIAITLEEYQEFIESIRRSRDPNEKELRKRLETQVIPIIEQRAEERAREASRRARELENLQKLATAKRSSRIADKMEKAKAVEEAEAHERKRLADLEMAHKEQERQDKLDEERQSRMMTREQRIREREVKRILHEEQLEREKEQLARLEEQGKIADAERARISERKLKSDMEKRQRELEQLQQQEDDWFFDCSVCGMHGQNLDDGSLSIACEKCNVWQHSACHGITKEQAERDDFHFICRDCKHKMENPIPLLKLNFSASPPSVKQQHKPNVAAGDEALSKVKAPKAPRAPKVPKIPKIPKVPKVPKDPNAPKRPKVPKGIKIPNGVNMSSVHHYVPPGYRPPSAGSSTVNGIGPGPSVSPTKPISPLVYPGPPPRPPLGASPQLLPSIHHSYPAPHSPSPPRPSSSGYANDSHLPNGHPSTTPAASKPQHLSYASNGGNQQPYSPYKNNTYQPHSFGSWPTQRSPYQQPYSSNQSPAPQYQPSPPTHQQQQQQQQHFYRPSNNPTAAFSPHKPQSPAAPPSSSPSLNGHIGYQPLHTAPALSPSTAPPILSPPVKNPSPIHSLTERLVEAISPAPQGQPQSGPSQQPPSIQFSPKQDPLVQVPPKQEQPIQPPVKHDQILQLPQKHDAIIQTPSRTEPLLHLSPRQESSVKSPTKHEPPIPPRPMQETQTSQARVGPAISQLLSPSFPLEAAPKLPQPTPSVVAASSDVPSSSSAPSGSS